MIEQGFIQAGLTLLAIIVVSFVIALGILGMFELWEKLRAWQRGTPSTKPQANTS